MARLARLVPAAQAATHAHDDAAAELLGVNRTDLRCLGVVLERGPLSASDLATTVGLTRGAMTTALDRLERTGYVRRREDPADRRGVRVEATAAARKAVRDVWEPVGAAGLELLERYDDRELAALCRFFEAYVQVQSAHTARLRSLTSRRSRRPT